MLYIIMADGQGKRWDNYLNIPKHLIRIEEETLLARTTRLLHEHDVDCKVLITSHNPEYETAGAELYEPLNNHLEIDRFTEELIDDNVCFLYGDTYYSSDAIRKITQEPVQDLLFFGTHHSIIAVKIKDGELFKKHKCRVRNLYLQGEIEKCIGWQVYQSFQDLPFDKKQVAEKFFLIEDWTKNINSPEDFEKSIRKENNDNKVMEDKKYDRHNKICAEDDQASGVEYHCLWPGCEGIYGSGS